MFFQKQTTKFFNWYNPYNCWKVVSNIVLGLIGKVSCNLHKVLSWNQNSKPGNSQGSFYQTKFVKLSFSPLMIRFSFAFFFNFAYCGGAVFVLWFWTSQFAIEGVWEKTYTLSPSQINKIKKGGFSWEFIHILTFSSIIRVINCPNARENGYFCIKCAKNVAFAPLMWI